MKGTGARKAARQPDNPFYKKYHERLYGSLAGGNLRGMMEPGGSVEN